MVYLILSPNLASPKVRYERTFKRARFGEKITKKMFKDRDTDELERGIGEVISLADYSIDASGSMKNMLRETDKIFRIATGT